MTDATARPDLATIAARHRTPHWCWGIDPIMGEGQRMFGTRDDVPCDAAALLSEIERRGDDLGAAWAAAEVASLSSGMSSGGWVVVAIERTPNEPVEYRAIEQSGQPHEYGPWAPTPTAALHALAAAPPSSDADLETYRDDDSLFPAAKEEKP